MNIEDENELPLEAMIELPPALLAAIDKTRAMQATPAQVADLVARASGLGKPTRATNPAPQAGLLRVAEFVAVVAALVLLYVALSPPVRRPQGPPGPDIADSESGPVYSAVTTVSLTDVGVDQIANEIRTAESRITLAQQSIELAAVRRELRMALDEYPRWGTP